MENMGGHTMRTAIGTAVRKLDTTAVQMQAAYANHFTPQSCIHGCIGSYIRPGSAQMLHRGARQKIGANRKMLLFPSNSCRLTFSCCPLVQQPVDCQTLTTEQQPSANSSGSQQPVADIWKEMKIHEKHWMP